MLLMRLLRVCDKIDVVLHRDGSMEVMDNGRGIPVGKHKKRSVSALEVVLTELHAGGKFGGGAYSSSGGFMVSVLPWLMLYLPNSSQKLTATGAPISSVSKTVLQVNSTQMESSEPVTHLRNQRKRKNWSRIRFWPDLEVFDPDAEIDFELVCQRVARTCFIVPGLKVRVEDKRTGQKMNLLNTSAEAAIRSG